MTTAPVQPRARTRLARDTWIEASAAYGRACLTSDNLALLAELQQASANAYHAWQAAGRAEREGA